MTFDLEGSYLDRAALVIMHYQVDVFDILFGEEPSPLLDACNSLIRQWRATGRPLFFPNFSMGADYEHAPPPTNRQIAPYLPSGRFKTGLPVKGLAVEHDDDVYECPRASVFHGTTLDADLKARDVRSLVMAGISTTGVVLSSVAWACDADYDVRLVRDCCHDPDQDAHRALFASSFGGRALIV